MTLLDCLCLISLSHIRGPHILCRRDDKDRINFANFRSSLKSPYRYATDTKMPSRTEKNYANSRVRRHSGEVILSKKRSKKEKETDTDSVTTSSSADTLATEPKCPMRFMLSGVLETQTEEKLQVRGCPLRRVQLWHTIPLCLLAIINLLIIIVALLGLASYRLVLGTQAVVVKFAKAQFDFESAVENAPDTAKDSPANE